MRTLIRIVACAAVPALVAGCGDVSRQGRSPVQVVVTALEAASGATPSQYGGTLDSDVITNVQTTINSQPVLVPTVFNDIGKVTMTMVLKDPGAPGSPASPSSLNQVTFTRYRVTYVRGDGRSDVPAPFDSAATFTVPAGGTVTASFELVRHTAKEEAPLLALRSDPAIISTIADVSFYGRDQAGNDVTATGKIGIFFGNFGDPR